MFKQLRPEFLIFSEENAKYSQIDMKVKQYQKEDHLLIQLDKLLGPNKDPNPKAMIKGIERTKVFYELAAGCIFFTYILQATSR